MRVERYAAGDANVWDGLVHRSKNGTFLFSRGYMDYHRDRFEDFSLLVFDDSGTLVAALPANRTGTLLSSHAGLTYGGFITDENMKVPKMLQVFESALQFLQDHSFTRVVYKTVPHIYHRAPAEEDCYALFLCDAKVSRRGVLAVIDSRNALPFQERRTRGVKKARQNGVIARQTDDLASYWGILTERLQEGFGAQPVHSLDEIRALRAAFPQNIKLFCAYEGDVMLGGVMIYETERVARVQYIATNERGRKLGALDLLFGDLIGEHYRSTAYFDFGTSDQEDGRSLNTGLMDQKEGYGARAVVHDHYEVNLESWQPGQLTAAMR